MFVKIKFSYFISIILLVLLNGVSLIPSFAVSSTPAPASSPYPPGCFDLECYVKPDLITSDSSAFKDFQVQLEYQEKVHFQEKTDENGYIKFNMVGTVPWTVTISKPGFLARSMDVFQVIRLGTMETPLLIWAGDMNQDNVINMADIVELAKGFGTTYGDAGFNAFADFNSDKATNMSDVVIACKHYH